MSSGRMKPCTLICRYLTISLTVMETACSVRSTQGSTVHIAPPA